MKKFNSQYHHRHSIRLKGFDYKKEGMYFITICTTNRDQIFGQIENNEMLFSSLGRIAYNEWLRSAEIRPNIEMDEFVVMPNHIHGIIIINNAPTTQDLIESAPAEPKIMHMTDITTTFTNHLKSKGLEYIENNRSYLMTYGVLTIISLVIDFLLFGCSIFKMSNDTPVTFIFISFVGFFRDCPNARSCGTYVG